MKLVLSITTAPEGCGMEGQVEEFSESGGTFGRGPANQWILPDPSRHVSSTHGRISYQGGQFFLEDASTNGTYLNDEEYPIGPGNKKELVAGDLLVFGDYTLQVDIVEDPQQPIATDETLGFALPASGAGSSTPAEANAFDDLDKWLDPIPQKQTSSESYASKPMTSSSSEATHLFGDIEHKNDSQDPLDALAGSSQKKESDPFSLDDLLSGGSSHEHVASQVPPSQANMNRLDIPRIPDDDSLFGGPSSKRNAPVHNDTPAPQSVDDPLAALGAPSIHHTDAPFRPEPAKPVPPKTPPMPEPVKAEPVNAESSPLDDFLGLNEGEPSAPTPAAPPKVAPASAVTTTFEAITPDKLNAASSKPPSDHHTDALDDFLGASDAATPKAPAPEFKTPAQEVKTPTPAPEPAPLETPITAKEARTQLASKPVLPSDETLIGPEHLAELPAIQDAFDHDFSKDHFVPEAASPTPMALPKEKAPEAKNPAAESQPKPDSGPRIKPRAESSARKSETDSVPAPRAEASVPASVANSSAANNSASDNSNIADKLGLTNLSDAQKTAFPTLVAKVIKETVKGLMTSLRARNQIKSEFRMNVTMIQAAENNPLKFSVTPDDALENMFMKTGKAYMPAPDAIADGFADLADHQIALFDAMRTAYESTVKSFDPLTLEEAIGGKNKGFLGSRKGQTWENYKTHYEKLVADKEDSFKRLFGEVFAAAYEKRMNELKMNRKR